MKIISVLSILIILISSIHSLSTSSETSVPTKITADLLAHVKIYSNLAEIVQPLSQPVIEFSADDWADIRSDSITLVGTDVNVTRQIMSEKKKSLDNLEINIRSPSSSSARTIFRKATMIDEKRNLVKFVDEEISKDPVYITVSDSDIVHNEMPPKSKYYVNFTYQADDVVYLSYLRSNLNWKTRYQLNLFEESKAPVLIAMADIRNDGKSKVNIEHAELLGGDINLRMEMSERRMFRTVSFSAASLNSGSVSDENADALSVSEGQEISGLYVFAINQPFSIDAKTNYVLPMFRPKVTVERFALISKTFYSSTKYSLGKAKRSYRLISDRFLSHGNCLIRESDRLVGETNFPDIAANDKHEFSIGDDADVTYKETILTVSTRVYNETVGPTEKDIRLRTESIYDFTLLVKNFKTHRAVKVEYEQLATARSVKLLTVGQLFKQEGSKIKFDIMMEPKGEKTFSYRLEIID